MVISSRDRMNILDADTTSWTARENNEPFIEILVCGFQPSLGLEVIRIGEDLLVHVHENTTDAYDCLCVPKLAGNLIRMNHGSTYACWYHFAVKLEASGWNNSG